MDIRATLQDALQSYTGTALNGYSFLTSNADETLFTVVSVGQLREQRIVDTGLVVRLLNGQIIIEHDVNSDPLVDTLLMAGVPRSAIILAYAGETAPAFNAEF